MRLLILRGITMTYFDVVNKAIDLTIVTDTDTGVTYLEPRYRMVLEESDIHLPGHMLQGDAKDQELWEILKLEVEKRNAKSDYLKPVLEWCYNTIVGTVDPAIQLGEDELMKDMLEYMKLKKDLDESHTAEQEEVKPKKAKLPLGINFAKKT